MLSNIVIIILINKIYSVLFEQENDFIKMLTSYTNLL